MTTPRASPGAPNSPDATRRSLRRRVRRIAITLAVVLVVFLGVAYMLPIWASTEQGRAYVVERINRNLNGTLHVQHWQLGWFTGIRLEGVTLKNRAGATVFSCDSVQTDFTLWHWLWGNYDVGSTTISSPRVVATRYPDAANDFTRIFADPKSTPERPDHSRATRILASLRGAIRLEHGQLILQSATTPGQISLTDLTAQALIASPTTPIRLTLRATSTVPPSPANPQPVILEGNFPPLTQWTGNPAWLLRDVELVAGNLPVAPLADWLDASPDWAQALGPTLDELSFTNHPPIGSALATPTATLRGPAGSVQVKLLMQTRENAVTFSLPDTRSYYARATLTMAPPVARLLAYVNPTLASALPGKGSATLNLSEGELTLAPPAGPSAATAPSASAQFAGLLTLTGIELADIGLVHDIATLAPSPGRPVAHSPRTFPALIPPTRLRLDDGRITCDSFILAIPGFSRLTFTGSTSVDGSAQLLLTLPMRQLGIPSILGSSTIDLTIRGTVTAPTLDRRPLAEAK